MTARLTLAGGADIDALMTVMAAAFAPGFGEAWSAAQVLASLATATAWARIAHGADGAPLGFTLSRHISGEAELLLIAVVPAARRAGVGRTLLAAAVADARAYGSAAMFLEVRDGNGAATALYRAAGWQVVGRRRDYYRSAAGERFDALTLRRRLNDWNMAV